MLDFIKKYSFAFIGILSGIANGLFGSGGGMIAVPMLEKSGLDTKKAHATSIAVTFIFSLISCIVYSLNQNINFKTALKFVPMGVIGAVLGAVLLKKINNKYLHKIFGLLMIIAGIRLIFKG